MEEGVNKISLKAKLTFLKPVLPRMTSTGKKLIGECGMRWSTKYNIEKKESFMVMLHKEALRSKKHHQAFNNV